MSEPQLRALSAPRPCAVLVVFAVSCAALLALGGCVSSRYRFVGKNAPPPRLLDVPFPQPQDAGPAALDAKLATVIVDGGPGSWKREAYWDEYVVTLHNTGEQPLKLDSAALRDSTDARRAPGDDPWKLEKESKALSQRYKEAGISVARIAAPRVLAAAAEPTVVGAAGLSTAAAAAAATATAAALPAVGVASYGRMRHNKSLITSEFNRRRLPLPATFNPGETRTASLFFPMVPNPRALELTWSSGEAKGTSILPLDFLDGLHVKKAGVKTAPQSSSP